MAKLLNNVQQTASQKAMVAAGKAFVSQAKRGDLADLDRFCDNIAAFRDVVKQTGQGKGKRISGAATHEAADQLTALQAVLTIGNVPTIA